MINFVTVRTFFEPSDLLIPQTLLESEGIECFVKDECITRVYPVAGIVGGIKLQVKEEDAERAVQVLMDGGFLTEDDLKPSGMYMAIEKFLDKFRKKG